MSKEQGGRCDERPYMVPSSIIHMVIIVEPHGFQLPLIELEHLGGIYRCGVRPIHGNGPRVKIVPGEIVEDMMDDVI